MIRSAVFLAIIAAAFAVPVQQPTFVAPPSYFFEGVFSIPQYGIFEELTVHTDTVADMQRVSYYGGRDTYLIRQQMSYEVVPRIDKMVCFTTNSSGGPTENDAPAYVPLAPFVPKDLTGWDYKGEEVVRNIPCHVWQMEVHNFTKTATYRFAVSQIGGIPVQLHLDGLNYIQGSHPDLYVLDFHLFVPFAAHEAFAVPALCQQPPSASEDAIPTAARVAARVRGVIDRLAIVAPPQNLCEGNSDEFVSFLHAHGKRYATCAESLHRESVWRSHMEYINIHNSANDVSFTLAPNRFADLSNDEFRALMLQRRGRAHNNGATRQHVRNTNDILPSSIDWREHGAVAPARDQGVCGSCWSFGSAASLEGVYALKHGRLVNVSTQQIVDCAWGYTWSGPGGNLGCDGGYASGMFQWAIDNGGIATYETYPYTMQDGWCNARDHSSGIKVTGYVNVSSVDDLRHAVATVGPVAIAIDASHPSFRFYASGVYYEPECKSDIDSLDHEIVAVGYGVAADGTQYWIVKNSWSTDGWGDKGFALMSMKDNNCGVGTQATYPIVA